MKALSRSTVSMAAAIDVIDGCITEATDLGVQVVVSVTDPAGHPVAMTRMDGSPMLSIDVAAAKAWTVAAFGHPTAWWADLLSSEPGLSALGGASERFMPVPGGVPLMADGSIVGAVGVSGATAEQDDRIARAGAGTMDLQTFTTGRMEHLVRAYFDACNSGDAERVAACFVADGVHYFPPGMYGGPFVGAETIGRRWAQAVAEMGSVWTVDNFVGDPYTGVAVIEWTHFKTKEGTVLRGDEWYRFDRQTGLIAEIRAYYAAPQPTGRERLELGGFDYRAHGYATEPPIDRTGE